MECRGKFSHKVLRKAQFAGFHFDDLLNFRSVEKDKVTGKVSFLRYSPERRLTQFTIGCCENTEFQQAGPRSQDEVDHKSEGDERC